MISLFRSDLLGAIRTTAVDVKRNGKIDYAGDNRISRSVRECVVRDGKNAVRPRHLVWPEYDHDRSAVMSEQIVSVDGRDSWNVRWTGEGNALVTHQRIEISADGSKTHPMSFPVGTREAREYREGKLLWTAKYDMDNRSLGRRDFKYDNLGRKIRETDPHSGETDYEYDAHDNSNKVTAPPAADAKPRLVIRHRYDQNGRRI